MPEATIREKIAHILTIYPVLSPSMIQTSLGNVSPKVWKPVLETMIQEGELHRGETVAPTPSQQHRCYVQISLNNKDAA